MTGEADYLGAQMAVWGQEELCDSRNPAAARVVRAGLKELLTRELGDGLLIDVGGYRGLQVEGLRAVVCDLSLPALRDATTRVSGALQAEIHDLPFADGCARGILLSHVFEHSHRPDHLLEEIDRVLEPGGFLCVVVPNAAGLGQILKLIRHGDVKPSGNPPWEPAEHIHHFTRANSTKYFTDQGWRIDHFEGDILDFPLRDKLRLHGLAGSLGRKFGKRAESLVFILRRAGA